jgi:transposase-like protein
LRCDFEFNQAMVFQKYSPDCKFAAVRAALDGKDLAEINRSLGAQISQDSLYCWTSLYERTQAVVCDQSTYLPRGRPFDLTNEDLQFIKELLTDKPTMYVNEIQRALIEQHGISVSMTTILNSLHDCLQMLKKMIRKVNPRQDPNKRALYISQVAFIPSSCLVFTGMLIVSVLLNLLSLMLMLTLFANSFDQMSQVCLLRPLLEPEDGPELANKPLKFIESVRPINTMSYRQF